MHPCINVASRNNFISDTNKKVCELFADVVCNYQYYTSGLFIIFYEVQVLLYNLLLLKSRRY